MPSEPTFTVTGDEGDFPNFSASDYGGVPSLRLTASVPVTWTYAPAYIVVNNPRNFYSTSSHCDSWETEYPSQNAIVFGGGIVNAQWGHDCDIEWNVRATASDGTYLDMTVEVDGTNDWFDNDTE